jgi:hypothetical protein
MNHKWNGRTIAHPDHAKELEAASAEHEFGASKMPRAQAEEHAYAQYKHKNHQSGAAHHLRNLRVAVASGDREEAERHSTLYKLHMQAMGHNANQNAPPEVEDAARKPMTEKMHASRSHKSDALLMSGPLAKSGWDAMGLTPLMKADGPIGPIKPQAHQAATKKPSAAKAPSQSKGGAGGGQKSIGELKAGSRPSMGGHKNTISAKEQQAGEQHFDEGSQVKYRDIKGDHQVPPDWVATVVRHHLITMHSTSNPGPKHLYEITWRTPQGKTIDDFVDQDRLQPLKPSKG